MFSSRHMMKYAPQKRKSRNMGGEHRNSSSVCVREREREGGERERERETHEFKEQGGRRKVEGASRASKLILN